ncbi:hypothetical protein FRC07_002768 [Ceratobasidium sp. 392]|nr:hypothetical protein FRC07_002768 [Ceratobasidium sp. 392]
MATTDSNQGDTLTSNLRVARNRTFSIALFDVIQTVPGEIQLYRKQVRNGRMSLVCALFIMVRYVSIVSLILNGVGFYGTTFTDESCEAFRLAPPVTKMFAGIASQGIIFLRTWAISRKSRTVLIILSVLFVMCLPFLVLGNVWMRNPYVKNGSCIAKQAPGTFNSAPMYYGAMSGFDLVACGLATYYLLDFTASSMSAFTRKILRHGMTHIKIYAFGTTFANIVVLMAVCHVKYIEKLGAFLSVAMTMIMAQHLVLDTQNFNDNSSTINVPSSHDPTLARQHPKSLGVESGKHHPTSLVHTPRGHGRNGFGGDTFELGVRVQTETHMDMDDLPAGTRAVDLQRAESFSSMGASGKGVPVQYDPERGYDKYEENNRQFGYDAKPPQ